MVGPCGEILLLFALAGPDAHAPPASRHWAWDPPRRPAVPGVEKSGWPRDAIDRFVLARLEKEGLTPSPEADRPTLIRRAFLDLTGLPPSPAAVDAFLEDPLPDAYERVVDGLLASSRFGERMASRWLDLARYADTSGYQTDGERSMWRWRDWVIGAFNANMPFDRFTIEQIAGDLLPEATVDQKLATGFHRNHRQNSEGEIIPEEYAVEYVVDRVDTTATAWLGLTLGCARCHDHKFDPFTQREFYQLFAFFNNVPESGKALKLGNSPPFITTPTREDAERLAAADRSLADAELELNRLEPEIAAAQSAWERSGEAQDTEDGGVPRGFAARFRLDGCGPDAGSGSQTPLFRGGEPAFAPGKIGGAADLDGARFLDAGDTGAFGYLDKLSLAAWIFPRGPAGGVIVARMQDDPSVEGYEVRLEGGKVQVNLVKRWLDDAIRVETRRTIEPDRWHHVLATYDGSRLARGVKVHVDGQLEELRVLLDELNQSFAAAQPLRIGARASDGRFHGLIDDVRVFSAALGAGEAAIAATPDPVESIASLEPAARSPAQAAKLRACFLESGAGARFRDVARRAAALRDEREKVLEGFPTTMVMAEMPAPRDAFVLLRGQYDGRGERVSPDVPAVLPPLPAGAPRNRLGLARWLVDSSNPLTSRVAVNRLWQMAFGAGLVRTPEDFGTRGEPPSHPDLLDALAVDFVAGGWDVKALLRRIVTSATYRQSSRTRADLLERDPENRLLARGPRFRLPAEAIRDQALLASGLLVERIGGPSVMPYLPEGLWKDLTGSDFTPGRGEALYRRSLYTFWKRTVPPPLMLTFDASPRDACSVRDARTNTPLQALMLLNDVAFVEASRALAERVLREAEGDRARTALAFRLVLGRSPGQAEHEVLLEDLARHRARYREAPGEALRLLAVGESRRDERVDPIEAAAHAAVASLILNLDETVTKE